MQRLRTFADDLICWFQPAAGEDVQDAPGPRVHARGDDLDLPLHPDHRPDSAGAVETEAWPVLQRKSPWWLLEACSSGGHIPPFFFFFTTLKKWFV